ncbi:hypothetical protein Aperf_G00000038515 [Anoplocephala perfoliata]
MSNDKDDEAWKSILDIKSETLKVWRFQDNGPVVAIPDDQLGFFLNDERYIVLKVSNHNRKLCYDLHFWTGLERAQKMPSDPPDRVSKVMTLIEHNLVVHREVGEFESPTFKSYFKEFGVLNGNVSSLFDVDHPERYTSRLLRFALTRNKSRIEVTEVVTSRNSLDSNDVFIFDEGTKMTQWNGRRCDDEERLAARKYIEKSLRARKTKCSSEFVDEEDLLENNELYRKLGTATVPPKRMHLRKNKFKKSMHRLSDETGKLVLHSVYQDKVYRVGINPDDVTFVDTLRVLYIYVGPGSNDNERSNTWKQADEYLKSVQMPFKSIAVFSAGNFCNGFEEVWDDLRN